MSGSDDRLIFLSLKPRFAEAILSVDKQIELRRQPPRLDVPTRALLYASSPTMSLVGTCLVDDIVDLAPATLWRRYGGVSGVTRLEFGAYFEGCPRAYGLRLSEAVRLDEPVSLGSIRQELDGFHPPQSFRYLTESQVDALVTL